MRILIPIKAGLEGAGLVWDQKIKTFTSKKLIFCLNFKVYSFYFKPFLLRTCVAYLDPDPDWIMILSGQWIRILEGKNDSQK
jgi:hypothetical protein